MFLWGNVLFVEDSIMEWVLKEPFSFNFKKWELKFLGYNLILVNSLNRNTAHLY